MTSSVEKPKTLSTQPANVEDNNDGDLASLIRDLSPTSQSKTVLLLQSLRKKEAVFGTDKSGRPVIEYKDEKSRKVGWDASSANVISQPKTDTDVQLRIDACLELIDYLKKNKSPSGVVLDGSIKPSEGFYRESKEFTKTGAVLGSGNSAGDIIVVKDETTETETALKTMMISVFREDEIRAWVDLIETGIPPALYCFKLEGNKIHMFMEKIERGITLRDVIDKHMTEIRAADPSLVKPFSLYVFHGLLSAVHTMHQKGWVHKDLHPGNIMLQESPEGIIKTRILDFGSARPFYSKDDGLRGFRSDIIEVVRKFTALYVSQEFYHETDARNNYKKQIEEMAAVFSLSPDDKKELFSLIESALQVTCLSEVPKLQQEIASKLEVDAKSLSKKVAKILFAKPDITKIGKTELYSGHTDVETENKPVVQDLETEPEKIKLVMGDNIKKVNESVKDCDDSHSSLDTIQMYM